MPAKDSENVDQLMKRLTADEKVFEYNFPNHLGLYKAA